MEYIINRGVAVIISNEFEGEKKRSACEKDIGLMEELFQSLKFEVKKYKSVTARQMLQEIKTESNKEYDCFALVISSHGKHVRSSTSSTADCWRHCVLGNDNKRIFINNIIHRLNRSKTLAGKPKLIFLQTCRTKKYDNVNDKEVQIAVEITNQSYDTGLPINTVTAKGDGDEDEDDDEDDKKSNDDNGLNDTKSDDSESDEEEDVDASSDESEIAGGSGATAGDSGAVAGMAGPAEIHDFFEIECPNDFLIMYPVMPGKKAFHGPNFGSAMLRYLNEYKSMLLERRSLLEYLTAVCGKMAMRNTATKLKGKKPAKLKQMLLRNLKAISKEEYRKPLMDIVGEGLGGILLKDADEIIVQERLKMHFEQYWAHPDQRVQKWFKKQMKMLIGMVLPFKTSACIMHRLKGKITFSG